MLMNNTAPTRMACCAGVCRNKRKETAGLRDNKKEDLSLLHALRSTSSFLAHLPTYAVAVKKRAPAHTTVLQCVVLHSHRAHHFATALRLFWPAGRDGDKRAELQESFTLRRSRLVVGDLIS